MRYLRISNNDIRSELARRLQDCERKKIGNEDSRNLSSLSFENNHVRFSQKAMFYIHDHYLAARQHGVIV
jgi:hypothetical protein